MTRPILSDQYSTLQAAINAGISQSRPIVIVPGVYTINSPLEIHGAARPEIILAGRIQPTVNMDSVFDVVGCTDFSLKGGEILVPNGVVIESAIWIRSDTSITATLVKRPYVGHLKIYQSGTGYFGTGIKLGKDDSDLLQCDEGFFERIAISNLFGQSGSRGIWFVSGWGNNLNHLIQGCYVYKCDTAYDIDGVNGVSLVGNTGDGGDPGSGGGVAALKIRSLNCIVAGGRFEAYQKLLYSGGIALTGSAMVTLNNVNCAAQEMADNDFVDWGWAGTLNLENVNCYSPAFEPHIKLRTSQKCILSGSFMVAGDTNRPLAANLIDGSTKALGKLWYVQAAADSGYVSAEEITYTGT